MPRSCGTGSRRWRPTPATTRSSSNGPKATTSSTSTAGATSMRSRRSGSRRSGTASPSSTTRSAEPARPRRALDDAGNGNRAVIELSEALARVVPVEDAHFLYASDGAAAVEQALKIVWQYWTNLGAPRSTYPRLRRRLPRRHDRRVVGRRPGLRHRHLRSADVSRAARAGVRRGRLLRRRDRDDRATRARAGGSDRRAAGAGRGRDAARRTRADRAAGRGVPGARRAADL